VLHNQLSPCPSPRRGYGWRLAWAADYCSAALPLCAAFGRAPLGWGTALAHKMTWACGERNVMVELEVNAHVIIVVELAVEV
jgi:hypothetical protein